MPFSPLKINRRVARLPKCIVAPDFHSSTVLVEDQWDYVEMWLKRRGLNDALFFWRQAEAFADASTNLPNTSSPLTNYYSALNATKAFLMAKGVMASPYHGLAGAKSPGKSSLARETITIRGAGVWPALAVYLGEPVTKGQTYTLKDVLYNLPYIHRAYTLTFTSQQELFIPVSDPMYVRLDGADRGWLKFEITESRYKNNHVFGRFQHFEHDIGVGEQFVVRCRNRFVWRDTEKEAQNLARLCNYHARMRRSMYYIKGLTHFWYLKREGNSNGRIERSSLTLTLMALHRLSEIARYNPDSLARHFDAQHNWLLSEFISRSLEQYLDELAAELTGANFMLPNYSTR